MNKHFVLNGNKLIAEFMEFKYIPFNNNQELKPGWWVNPITRGQQDTEHVSYKLGKSRFLGRNHHELKYHNSWDWLMPVVERIEQMDYLVNICDDICTIVYDKQPTVGGNKKIDAVYRSIIKFIKWYNENEK